MAYHAFRLASKIQVMPSYATPFTCATIAPAGGLRCVTFHRSFALKYLLLTVFLSITGCTASYQQSHVKEVVDKLDPDRGVYIFTPEDGSYMDREYRSSGKMTANAIRSAFIKHASRVVITYLCSNVECAVGIDPSEFGYFIEPSILHWEDRATEWSGKSDKLEIQLAIYDIATGDELASASLTGKSKWVTFGGDHPQDLLQEPIDRYVDSLYK